LGYATIKGFEVMRALKKGQARSWQFQDEVAGEVRLIERAFNLGDNPIAEMHQLLNQKIAAYS
jgi:hypothetical protein